MDKLVIFDLDGTLLDTIEDIRNALNKTLLKNGINANYSKDEVKSFIGSGALKLVTRALKKQNINDEEFILKIKDEYNSIYFNASNIYSCPFIGIIDMLDKLKRENFKLVVFSNKPDNNVKFIIDYYFKKNTFDMVRGQIDGIKPKPSVEGLNIILENFKNIQKDNIYYIGDSNIDMEIGKNAKLKTIGVSWGYCDKDILKSYKPYKIVDTCDELLNMLIKN